LAQAAALLHHSDQAVWPGPKGAQPMQNVVRSLVIVIQDLIGNLVPILEIAMVKAMERHFLQVLSMKNCKKEALVDHLLTMIF